MMEPGTRHPGNEGYAEEVDSLTRQYESVRFVDVHGPVLHLLPTAASRVLDDELVGTIQHLGKDEARDLLATFYGHGAATSPAR